MRQPTGAQAKYAYRRRELRLNASERDTLRDEYRREDLGKGVHGKYRTDFQAGSNLVLLAPDVAEVFATPQAVNDALRSLISVAERSARRAMRPVRQRSPRERAGKPGK